MGVGHADENSIEVLGPACRDLDLPAVPLQAAIREVAAQIARLEFARRQDLAHLVAREPQAQFLLLKSGFGTLDRAERADRGRDAHAQEHDRGEDLDEGKRAPEPLTGASHTLPPASS